MRSRRVPVIVVLAGLLVAAALTDGQGRDDDGAAVAFGRDEPFVMPVAAAASALTSTWYCPVANASGSGPAEGFVVMANAGRDDRTGTMTVFRSEGDPVRIDVDIPARSRRMVRLADAAPAPLAAALVEIDGGDVGVELIGQTDRGSETGACATAASDEWYLAHAVTTLGSHAWVSLFNPFPEDAIVDMTFATNEGPFAPQPLQALVVPAGGVMVVDLNDQVRRRTDIAMTLRARSGRLIAGRIQTFDGSAGAIGTSVNLAMPAPADTWRFATGLKAEGLSERMHVYNPNGREAEVDLTLATAEEFAEPFELTIPPESYVAVNLSEEERVPAGFHSATVQSLNGVPVVAERSFSSPEGTRRGYSLTPGAPLQAERWLFAHGEASDAIEENILVHNPGNTDLSVSVHVLARGQVQAVAEMQDVPVPAGGLVAIRPLDHIERRDLPVVVEATGPVVAERILSYITTLGLSVNPGIPLR